MHVVLHGSIGASEHGQCCLPPAACIEECAILIPSLRPCVAVGATSKPRVSLERWYCCTKTRQRSTHECEVGSDGASARKLWARELGEPDGKPRVRAGPSIEESIERLGIASPVVVQREEIHAAWGRCTWTATDAAEEGSKPVTTTSGDGRGAKPHIHCDKLWPKRHRFVNLHALPRLRFTVHVSSCA